MNEEQDNRFSHGAAGAGKKGAAMKKRGLRNLFISWVVLIGIGAGTAYAYTDYLKKTDGAGNGQTDGAAAPGRSRGLP